MLLYVRARAGTRDRAPSMRGFSRAWTRASAARFRDLADSSRFENAKFASMIPFYEKQQSVGRSINPAMFPAVRARVLRCHSTSPDHNFALHAAASSIHTHGD